MLISEAYNVQKQLRPT